MPLGRRQVIANERTDYNDFNASGTLCMANLALALAAFRNPRIGSPGVARGLELLANGTMSPTLKAGAAFVEGNSIVVPGLAIVEEDASLGPFASNADGNQYSRIDLVSIAYAEADDTPEQKIIVDPNTGATSQQSVDTQKGAAASVVITTGTAAATPAAPATPAGHLALYTVQVDWNVTQITQAKIIPLAGPAGSQWLSTEDPTDGEWLTQWWYSPSLDFYVPTNATALVLAVAAYRQLVNSPSDPLPSAGEVRIDQASAQDVHTGLSFRTVRGPNSDLDSARAATPVLYTADSINSYAGMSLLTSLSLAKVVPGPFAGTIQGQLWGLSGLGSLDATLFSFALGVFL